MSTDRAEALARYAARWETMSADDLARLDQWYTPDVRFRDPFNDVRGTDGIRRILEHMYESCAEARFEVHEQAASGDVGLLSWSFHFRLRRFSPGQARRIDGMSRVLLAEDGRVSEHVDHWDAAAQVYEQLPLLGALLRRVRRRLGA